MQPDMRPRAALAGPTTNNGDTTMLYVATSWATAAALLLLGYIDQHEDKLMSLDAAAGLASGAVVVAVVLTAALVVSTVWGFARRWRS